MFSFTFQLLGFSQRTPEQRFPKSLRCSVNIQFAVVRRRTNSIRSSGAVIDYQLVVIAVGRREQCDEFVQTHFAQTDLAYALFIIVDQVATEIAGAPRNRSVRVANNTRLTGVWINTTIGTCFVHIFKRITVFGLNRN